MKLFDIFRRKSADKSDDVSENNGVIIKFGFQEEGLTYQQAGKEIYVWFTWVNGNKIYPDEIKKWKDGTRLTDHEQEHVFLHLLDFVGRKKGKPIVVINLDDASKSLWEDLCSKNKSLIENIEYTSDEEDVQWNRERILKDLNSDSFKEGKLKTGIAGIQVNNEQDIERALASYIKQKREQLDT